MKALILNSGLGHRMGASFMARRLRLRPLTLVSSLSNRAALSPSEATERTLVSHL